MGLTESVNVVTYLANLQQDLCKKCIILDRGVAITRFRLAIVFSTLRGSKSLINYFLLFG